MKFIQQDITNTKAIEYIYQREGEPKMILNKGKESFLRCIDVLHNTKKLKPLIYKKELSIPIPDDKEIWSDHDYLTRLYNDKIHEFQSVKESSLHYFIGIPNPEIALVLQLVDDVDDFSKFKGKRQKNLLSNKFKYIY